MPEDELSKSFYAISDTHLERNSPCAAHLLKFLWDADLPVFMLGDMVEGYRDGNSLPHLSASNYVDAELAARISAAHWERRGVRGNHDNELFPILHSPDALMSLDAKVVVTHGHRWDFWFHTEEVEEVSDWWSKLAFGLDDLGLNCPASLTRRRRDRNLERNAFAWMKKRGVKLCVTGHTHVPQIIEKDGTTLATCGAWKYGPPYSVVRVDSGAASIVPWNGEKFV